MIDQCKLYFDAFSQGPDPYDSFNYLLEDKSFLSLLYIDRPQDLVLGAVLVLETNCMGKVFMEDYQDKSLHVVHCLTDLMAAPQGPWTWENVSSQLKRDGV